MSEGGRVWRLGDRIDTDVLAPGSLMKLDSKALATHCLKALRPDFAPGVRPGDVIVAGEAFGIGSSREQAAVSLKLLGVQAVLAKSFARIFFRNAFNQGLPAIVCPAAGAAREGDLLSLELGAGRAFNHSTGETYDFSPIPDHLMRIVSAGGLMAHLKRRLGRG
jgi:3-isopropylmalate/(R)-2-methylmalate dehydratase small subunit